MTTRLNSHVSSIWCILQKQRFCLTATYLGVPEAKTFEGLRQNPLQSVYPRLRRIIHQISSSIIDAEIGHIE